MGPFDRGCRAAAAWLLCLLSLLLAWPATARDVVALDLQQQPVPLAGGGEVWRDPSGRAGLQQVASDTTLAWAPADPSRIYPLDGGDALWIRFTVAPTSGTERWYLEIPYPGVDAVTLHTRDGQGTWTAARAGDSLAVLSWPVPHRHPILPLQVAAEGPREYLLHVRNHSGFSGGLRFVSDSYLSQSEQRVSLVLGMYFGLAGLAVLLAVVGMATLRDPAFGIYALSVVLMGLTQATTTGLAGLHLWPSWPWWNDIARQLMPMLAVASLQLLVAEVVSLRERSRVLYALMLAAAFAALPLAAVMMLDADGAQRLPVLLTYVLGASVAGLAVTVWAAVRGDRYAAWMLLGLLPVAIGALPLIARITGLVPISFWTTHGMQVALAIELPVILVVLALRSQHRREHVRRMHGLDRIDPATGLINAAVFHERLVRLIARSQRLRFRSALLLVDIGNIEPIRRQFGNEAAHEITLRVAGRLLSVAREIDTVARLSEHRFGILMEGPLHADEVAEAGPRVVARCLMPFRHRPLEWTAHVKVAQALIPMDGTDPSQLIGRLELLLASAPSDSRRAVFMLSRPPLHSAPTPLV